MFLLLPDASEDIEELKSKQSRRKIFIGVGVVIAVLVVAGIVYLILAY